jgi:Tetratricopeptide repeat/Protein of unknown function (DUF2914)
MPEPRDVQTVVNAAEQAAAAGDYASAEKLLREAAALQETSLGPLHPDLANTLNNLAVVCEITEKPADAERFFRRAWEIAKAALAADHPFVATSRKNLEDFCKARGTPVDPPVAPPVKAPVTRDRPVTTEPTTKAKPKTAVPIPRDARGGWPRPVWIGVLIAGGLIVTFIATPLFRSNNPVESPPASPSASAADPAATAPASPPGKPAPADAPRDAKPAPPARPAASPSTPPAAAAKPSAGASTRLAPVVVTARLCKGLSTGEISSGGDWRCVPPGQPADPGAMYFYTRLKSPVDTTVQHRWFRGDRLRQAVDLRIRANTIGGYRTYSRNTINDLDPSEWRVELRTIDGVLLHQERFTVR